MYIDNNDNATKPLAMTQSNRYYLQSEIVCNEALELCIGGVPSTGQILCCYISVRFSCVWLPNICLSSSSFYLSWQDAKFLLIFSTGIIISSALNPAFQLAKWTWTCSCSHIVRWSFWIWDIVILLPQAIFFDFGNLWISNTVQHLEA